MNDFIRRVTVLVAAGSLLVGCTGQPSPAPTSTAQGPTSQASRSSEPATSTAESVTGSAEDRLAAGLDVLLGVQAKYDNLIMGVQISVGGVSMLSYRRPDLSADATTDVFSVTNSVVSALVGIAIDEGLIPGVEATIDELLPQYAADMSTEERQITLRHLLTMTAGIGALSGTVLQSDDWLRAILATSQGRPDSAFGYSNAGSHLLSAIVSTAAGMPTAEYAQQKLFSPLGIALAPLAGPLPTGSEAEFDAAYGALPGVVWPADPQGYATGFGLLKLSAEHLLRFGQLYLAGGLWNGVQIVPADWVAESTRTQIDGVTGFPGYGYQWWTFEVNTRYAVFAAIGDAGQLVEVIPELDAVVVVSSSDQSYDPINSDSLLDLVSNYLVSELG